jgi:hypothetical protein
MRWHFALAGDQEHSNYLPSSLHEIRITTRGPTTRPRTLKPSYDRRGRGAAQAGAKDDSGAVCIPKHHSDPCLSSLAHPSR